MQENLSFDYARKNGTDFNKLIQKASKNGIISQEELSILSRVYKENMSSVIKINKNNLKILSESLNSDNSLKNTFNKLINLQETNDYNPIKNYIFTLKKYQDLDITKENSSEVLKRGGTHDIFFAVQGLLISLNKKYDPKGVDGFYGKNTKAAILLFQQDNNLNKQNGILTSETIKKLIKLLEKSTAEEDLPVKEEKLLVEEDESSVEEDESSVEEDKSSVEEDKSTAEEDLPVKEEKLLVEEDEFVATKEDLTIFNDLLLRQKEDISGEKEQKNQLSLERINQFNYVVWETYKVRQKITDPTILETFEANIDNTNVKNEFKVQFLDTLIKYYDSVGNSEKSRELAKKYLDIIDANPSMEYHVEDYEFAKKIVGNNETEE